MYENSSNNQTASNINPVKKRQQLLSVLSVSEFSVIQSYWEKLSITPRYSLLKSPEVGMTMVRAKTGGTGQPFNMGEMTVTRTVIRLDSDVDSEVSSMVNSEANSVGNTINRQSNIIGFGYTAGRNTQKSELIAVIDAYCQLPEYEALITENVIEPLQHIREQQQHDQAAQVNATKVNFFTMVRGE